ncbi:3-phosphoserine/phosphohydroxythreonine transaminase [Wohlfahrtiimonas chitiniclastica]|uniref:3-phosphoserine/phosphohydroxythreonine transaminase n=1 Tax=Wohlfahrtiimonas chitiniclastica TaxID=400946 RepID=UPI0021577C2A|nr:3-phosphoserine/phosphohydroxythreonine transaminase [Wohlfahrtiimonas chitiniclastica]MDC7251542.1 phosphoserine aminotransferase [Wohlfahrtiimonas chitiniclastica]
MERNYNFCAGPSTLPESVLKQAQAELLNWQGLGASVMEVSHRSKEFEAVVRNCENKMRSLLNIPENYKVLFLQGGGFGQFTMIPMNILGNKTQIDAIETGVWSGKALKAMAHHANINLVASTKETKFTTLPDLNALNFSKDSAFVHYCDNETINGVEFRAPLTGCETPVVADMSSNILSRAFDVSKFGLIYAGAQKNIGPSGVTLVIVREDLLGQADPKTSDVFNYEVQAKNMSMINTPPTFSLYMIDLVLTWLQGQGGVEAIEKINAEKAAMLYGLIDHSDFYHNPVAIDARSRMNIPFTIANPELDPIFLAKAKEQGLINLEGHRSVGGMRASIYNAMPLEGVRALCEFMSDFEKQYG